MSANHLLVGFKQTAKSVASYIFPTKVKGEHNVLKKMQLDAMSERSTVSQLIFHRTYVEEDTDTKKPFGYYIMGDQKYGIVFEVDPPSYLSNDIENLIISALSLVVKDDTVVHINTFGSNNIDNTMDTYKKLKEVNRKKKINLKNPEKVESFIDNQEKYFKKWTKESILGSEGDMRVRNLRNTVSILFPYDTDIEAVKKQYFQLMGILGELNPRCLPASEFIPLIKEFIAPQLERFPDSNDYMTTINKQITNGSDILLDEDNGNIYLGSNKEYTGRVLTTEKYPPSIDLFTYQNAFFDVMGNDAQMNIPNKFMLSLTIEFSKIEKTRKKILKKAKGNYKNIAPLGPKIEKILPDIKILKLESEQAIYILDQLGENAVKGKWDIFVLDEDESVVEQTIGQLKKSFESIPGRWLLKEETFSKIAFQILLQSIPLNYSQIFQDNVKKQDMMFKSNTAQIAPLLSDVKGIGGNPTHFFIGRTGQIVGIDFFASKQNYNIVITGPQGSGKSVLGNYIQMAGLAAGWDIRMIDFGRTYEKLNKNIGGQFIEFKKNNNLCLNFFTFINTTVVADLATRKEIEVIDPDEFDTIVPMVGLMMSISLRNIYKLDSTSEKEKLELAAISTFVKRGLVRAFEMAGREAGMREVGLALEKMREEYINEDAQNNVDSIRILGLMVNALHSYTNERGEFFKYYNGENNVNIKSKHLIAELDDISDSPMLPVVAMGLLQRMAQEAFIEYLKDKDTARLIGVDEAWKVLDSPIFSAFLEDFARRIRKYRGITLILTQTASEFYKNSASKVIYDTASFKLTLPTSSDMIETAIKDGCIDGKNKFSVNLMKSLKFRKPHYNEVHIKYADAQFVVCMKLTPDDYWTFTSDPEDRSRIDRVMQEKSFDLNDTIWYLARKSEGMREDQITYLLSQKDKGSKANEEWDTFFTDALHGKKIKVASQGIYNVENRANPKKDAEELFMRLESKGHVYSNSYFKEAAISRGFYIDISKQFIDRSLDYLMQSNKESQISINLDILEIKNKDFTEHLFERIEELGERKSQLIFDVVLNYDTKENIKTLLEFANKAKNYGVNIAFDNIDFSHLDIRTLLQIKPRQFKINLEDLRELLEDEVSANYAKSLVYSLLQTGKANNTKTVFVKVEDEEDLDLLEEFEVKYAQGYKYDRPEIAE